MCTFVYCVLAQVHCTVPLYKYLGKSPYTKCAPLRLRPICTMSTSYGSNDYDEDDSVSTHDSNNVFKKYECTICNRKFVRRFTLDRHLKTVHGEETNDETSDTEEEDNGESEEDKSEDERSSTDDESSEEEEDKKGQYVSDMFIGLVNQVAAICNDELSPLIEDEMDRGESEDTATLHAIQRCPTAKKTLRQLFTNHAFALEQHRRHPLYRAIMEKVCSLKKKKKGFSDREALESAVSYRKHGLYKLLDYIL